MRKCELEACSGGICIRRSTFLCIFYFFLIFFILSMTFGCTRKFSYGLWQGVAGRYACPAASYQSQKPMASGGLAGVIQALVNIRRRSRSPESVYTYAKSRKCQRSFLRMPSCCTHSLCQSRVYLTTITPSHRHFHVHAGRRSDAATS